MPHLVAVPKENSDLVIKICPRGDEFIHYAKACMSGELYGGAFLNVYEAKEFANGSWMFVVEKAERSMDHEFWDNIRWTFCGYNDFELSEEQRKTVEYLTPQVQQIRDKGWFLDLHRGNVMYRKDGSIVLIDPVS